MVIRFSSFLTGDILKEWRRGGRLRCHHCDKKYATVGCANRSCRKTYHVPCGLRNGALMQFCDDFSSFCRAHRPRQEAGEVPGGATSCGVCLDDVEPKEEEEEALWAPCCKGW